MPSTTLVVSDAAESKLRELAQKTGCSVEEVLEQAVADYHRRQFWAAVNSGYAALRADATAWAAEEEDRRAWEALPDGLDKDESESAP